MMLMYKKLALTKEILLISQDTLYCILSQFMEIQLVLQHKNPKTALLLTQTNIINKITSKKISISNMYQYQPNNDQQAKELRDRMRNGTGAARLLQAEDAPTHYLDSLQRFKKNFAQFDKQQRQTDKTKRQIQLEKKRLEQLQRENRRWEVIEQYNDKLKNREEVNSHNQIMGARRSANTTSLAYNPISLSYDNNPEGDRLKRLDEDANIRRFVRATNIQDRGHSKYNPINGQNRELIKKIVPEQLNERFIHKLTNHYEHMSLKPSSMELSNSSYRNNFNVSNQKYF